MEVRFDIQLDNNDVVIKDNDFVLVESDQQHIVDTINACPSWWKENFADGVSIVSYLKGRDVQQPLSRSIKLQLKSDQYECTPSVTYDNYGTLNVNPNVAI